VLAAAAHGDALKLAGGDMLFKSLTEIPSLAAAVRRSEARRVPTGAAGAGGAWAGDKAVPVALVHAQSDT
jgi:hypothetical protein